MSGLTVVTAPADEPLNISEVKDFLRLDDQVDDSIIRTFIIGARQWAENYTGRAFITRTLKLSLDGLSEIDLPLQEGVRVGPYLSHYRNYIELPFPPVTSVSYVYYYDDSDNQSTWATTNYYVDTVREPARIVLRDGGTFPTDLRKANGIEVTYVTGYGSNPSDIPEAVRVAMMQWIAHMYEHRGDDEGRRVGLPVMATQLLQPYRVLRFSESAFTKNYKTGI